MKRIMVPGIAIFMLLLLATGALGTSLAIDIMNNSDTQLESRGSKIDTDQTIIGATIPMNQFQFDLEYTEGNLVFSKTNVDFDFGVFKTGYIMADSTPVKLVANLGYYYGAAKDFDLKLESGGMGFASTIQLTMRTTFDFSADWGFSGRYEHSGTRSNMKPLFQYQAKLNFQFDRNLGLTAGYRCLKLKKIDELTLSGYTFGATYSF